MNTGNTDFVATQRMSITSFFGNKQVITESKTYDVLPDTTRLVRMEWDGTPGLGLFRVTQAIDARYFDRENESLGEWTKTVLVIPLFLFIVIMLIVVVMIMMIVFKIIQVIARRRADK